MSQGFAIHALSSSNEIHPAPSEPFRARSIMSCLFVVVTVNGEGVESSVRPGSPTRVAAAVVLQLGADGPQQAAPGSTAHCGALRAKEPAPAAGHAHAHVARSAPQPIIQRVDEHGGGGGGGRLVDRPLLDRRHAAVWCVRRASQPLRALHDAVHRPIDEADAHFRRRHRAAVAAAHGAPAPRRAAAG
eukprot:scaffold10045_cov64-Phaeocystis_antarctica.AAC.3